MIVYIVTLVNKTLVIDVDSNDTVYSLKQQIFSTHAASQRLLVWGRPMQNEQTLLECGVCQESAIHHVLRIGSPNNDASIDYNIKGTPCRLMVAVDGSTQQHRITRTCSPYAELQHVTKTTGPFKIKSCGSLIENDQSVCDIANGDVLIAMC